MAEILDTRDLLEEVSPYDGEPIGHVDADERERVRAIRDLIAELEDNCDEEPRHGVTMVPEDGFEDYARQYAEDLHGEAIRNASWPFDRIDWESAAEDLATDYYEVEFEGVTYLCR